MMQGLPKVAYDVIQLKGGYDLLTPTLSLPSGYARDAVNFEVSINGGYTRIPGYERFDGQPAPSLAEFSGITLDAIANVAVGDTINGPSASADVIAIDGTTLILTKISGTFAVGEAIVNGVDPVGEVADTVVTFTSQQSAIYASLAADAYREDIEAVPGSGPIRGLATLGTDVYAWRNTTDGTAMAIYKASATGWSAVALGKELGFEDGVADIVAGNTVTGATSGATAVVARVLVREGDWGTGDATGTLIVSTVSGTFVAGENLQVSSVTKAVALGNATQIVLSPGGRVQAVTANFGSAYNLRIYGCDNVNPAFEFDGTVYAPIRTGMSPDAPDNVAVHSNHLFLGFGASLQFSAIADPYRWSPVFGAGEISTRQEITSLLSVQGNNASSALVIYSINETYILYGSSSGDFALTNYSVNMGCGRYGAQRLDTAYAFDDRGIVSLSTTDKFGNFDAATLTYNIRPVIQSRRTLLTATGINREKSQYRAFFSDGYCLYMTIVNGQLLGTMPVQFPNPVTVWAESLRSDRNEQAFFGSTNGFVYQMDSGSSFDGANIRSTLLLNYNAIRSPRVRKRYRRASLEVSGTAYAEFYLGYELGYGLPENEQPVDAPYDVRLSVSYWDSFTWDAFFWDGKVLAPTEVEMTGTAENVAIRIFGDSDYVKEFTINSVILHYTMRRGLR
jgi:hypothetical protein